MSADVAQYPRIWKIYSFMPTRYSGPKFI